MPKLSGCTKRWTVGASLWSTVAKTTSKICFTAPLHLKGAHHFICTVLKALLTVAFLLSPPFIIVEDWFAVPQLLAKLLDEPDKLQLLHQKCVDWWTRYRSRLRQLVFRVINNENSEASDGDNKVAPSTNAIATVRHTIEELLQQLEIAPLTSLDEAKAKQVGGAFCWLIAS
jgi:hypothetical protein